MTLHVPKPWVQLLLAAWLLTSYTLYPLPQKDVEFLEQNRETLHRIVVDEARLRGQTLTDRQILSAVDEQLDVERSRVWIRWLIRVCAVLIGVASTGLYLVQPQRKWLWIVIVMSGASVAIWAWPYLTTGSSVFDSFGEFASAIIASRSIRLLIEFCLFNVILPTIHIVAALILLRMATRFPGRSS